MQEREKKNVNEMMEEGKLQSLQSPNPGNQGSVLGSLTRIALENLSKTVVEAGVSEEKKSIAVERESSNTSETSNTSRASKFYIVGRENRLDKEFFQYCIAVGVSLLVIIFLLVQIIRHESDVYLNFLCAVLGGFFGRSSHSKVQKVNKG